MTPEEAGRERARQAIDQISQENLELCEPYSIVDEERFWKGFIQEITEQNG